MGGNSDEPLVTFGSPYFSFPSEFRVVTIFRERTRRCPRKEASRERRKSHKSFTRKTSRNSFGRRKHRPVRSTGARDRDFARVSQDRPGEEHGSLEGYGRNDDREDTRSAQARSHR